MDSDRRQQAEIRRQVRMGGSASAANAPLDPDAPVQVGGNATSGDYAWRAAGISNITSTGDPFYSAPGGEGLPLKDDYSSEVITDAWLNRIARRLEGVCTVDLSTGDVILDDAEEYECRTLKLVGALTAPRNVVVPTEDGPEWVVKNDTTGGFTATVKTAAGTGISVGQGKKAQVRCDGTNIERVTADV